VLLAAIATGIYIAAVDGAATHPPSGAAVPFTAISVATSVIGGIIVMSVSWLLYAGVFYAISTLLRGVGSFRRVFEFTGYGFIPQILSAILCRTSIYAPVNPRPFHQYDVCDSSSLAYSSHCGVLLWVFAVKHARNLPTNDALTTVIGSVVVGWLLLLFAAFAFSPPV